MSTQEQSAIQQRISRTNEMIIWLTENQMSFPKTFQLGAGVTVNDSKHCIDTVIATLTNYKEMKNFCYAFYAEYNLAYQLKQFHHAYTRTA